jgi:hypothetical protein
MKTLKTVLAVIAVLFLIGWVADAYSTATMQTEPTQQSKDNTKRNSAKSAFVKGCTGEGGAEDMCGCYFEALDKHYDYEWYDDDALIDRVLTDGYNYEEVNAAQTMCNTESTNEVQSI